MSFRGQVGCHCYYIFRERRLCHEKILCKTLIFMIFWKKILQKPPKMPLKSGPKRGTPKKAFPNTSCLFSLTWKRPSLQMQTTDQNTQGRTLSNGSVAFWHRYSRATHFYICTSSHQPFNLKPSISDYRYKRVPPVDWQNQRDVFATAGRCLLCRVWCCVSLS